MTDTTYDVEVTLNDFTEKEKRFAASNRAKRRWRLLKNVRMATRRTSLTKPEEQLLKAIGNKKKKNEPTPTTIAAATNNAALSAATAPAAPDETVGGAEPTPARRRLRQSLSLHRDSLSTNEYNFLQDLLEADDVSEEALSNTTDVLEKDVIYKQKLSVGVGGNNVGVTVSAHSRRRSSVLSSLRGSGKAEMMASIPEFEPEETPEHDIKHRRELWRTKQRSTVKEEKKEDDSNSDASDPAKDAPPPPPPSPLVTSFQDSPIVTLFKSVADLNFDFNSSTRTLDTAASSHSEDNNEKGKGGPIAEDEAPQTPAPVKFSFLGMSPTDEESTSLHVMTPPLLDTLRPYVPYAIQEDNLWLKYSLAKDGASIDVLLSKVRSSTHTILAIETTEGEVFGSFTSSPWRHMGSTYYGSCESFLWRMSKNRLTPCETAMDRAKLESDVEVFKWTGENRNIQMSGPKMIAVGGGEPDKVTERRLLSGRPGAAPAASSEKNVWADFGFALNADLSGGTTGRCVTFGSTSGLSRNGKGTFDVSNVEVWTLTPMGDVEQAEKLEMGRQFVFNSITAKPPPSIKPRQRTKMSRAA